VIPGFHQMKKKKKPKKFNQVSHLQRQKIQQKYIYIYITSQNKKKTHKPHSKTQKTRAKPTLLVQF
jgi:hypothetical protein